MDREYILALIRRRELGSAIRALLAIALLDGDQIGKVVHCPVQGLADILQLSYAQAKALRRRLLDYRYIEMVGRQSLRRTPARIWLRMGLKHHPERDSTTSQNGIETPSQNGIEGLASGHTYQPEAMGLKDQPKDGLEHYPLARGKAVKGCQRIKRQTAPATSEVNGTSSGSSPESDCLSNSQGEKTTTKQRLQRWSYGAARVACKHLALDKTDANGIASELRRLAAKHRDGIDDGMRSAASLLEDLTVNAEASFADGAAIVGALRNRWGEWTQPGGTVPTWTPPEPLVDPDEPTTAELRMKQIIADAVSSDKPATIDDVMALAEGKKAPPTGESGSKEGRSRAVAESDVALIAELREHAVEHPCSSPAETEAPSRYARQAANHIVCLWRHEDGRESLLLRGEGQRPPQRSTVRGWALAAWPELAFESLDVVEDAPAVTITTREAVA